MSDPTRSGQDILARLFERIEQRRRERPAGSYVTTLLDEGHEAIASKVLEEARELVEAAAADDPEHTAHEAADLLFHVCVLLADAGVSLDEALRELERRFGVSGLAEKAARANASKPKVGS